MSTNTMEYLGDVSGCVHQGVLPEVAGYTDTEPNSESTMDWGERGVEIRTKNLGIAAFLVGVELPQPHERQKSIDSSVCCGACDGYVEVQSDEEAQPQPVQQRSTTQIIGQLALF